MGKIQDLLKYHIKESGHTIYSISQAAELNRTTLNKALNEQRTITAEQFNGILPFLRLTPKEREELQEAFLINQIGEGRYQCHMYIKKMLETSIKISPNADTAVAYSRFGNTNVDTQEILSDVFFVSDKIRIINVICRLVEQAAEKNESAYAYGFVSFQDDYTATLCRQLNHVEKLRMKHLVEFVKESEGVNDRNTLYNLKTLCNMLPFVAECKTEFSIYYYYVMNEIGYHNKASIFPYYLILNDYVVLLSENYDYACFMADKEIHAHYLSSYEHIIQEAYVLTDGIISNTALLTYLIAADKEANHVCFQPQPLIELFVEDEMIDKYMYDIPYKEDIKAAFQTRINQLKQSISSGTILFTYSGLKLFAKEGKGINIPDTFAAHFDIPDRIAILERIIASNEASDDNEFLLIDENKFHAGVEITLTPIGAQNILIVLNTKEQGVITVDMQESTLVQAISDFFNNIMVYGFAHSKEETNIVLQRMIDKLRKE